MPLRIRDEELGMGWLTTVRGITTLVAVTLVGAAPAHADGRWTFTEVSKTPAYWDSSGASSAAFMADGRLVVAGGTYVWRGDGDENFAAIAVVRYNPDLSLDTSFSQDGKLTTDIDAARYAGASDVMIQADGKILVAGSTGRSPSGDFVLVRYRADGSLDPSFGTGGIVTTDFGVYERVNAAALQPDGKIVVLGESIDTGASESPWSLALARYRTDGSLDPSFSGDGMLTLNVGDSVNGEALALQDDGKVLVGGGHHLLRLRPDGSLDPSFGADGVVFDDAHDIRGLGIQSDGRIVSAGHNGQFAFARYLADGTLDWSFGIAGRKSIDFGEYGGALNGIAIQPANGDIVAVGDQYWSDWISGNYGINLLAAGLGADGGAGTGSWGEWGDLPGGQEQGAAATAIAPDGQIAIVGYGGTWSDWPNRFLVGRLDGETGTPAVTTITGGPSGTITDAAPAFTFTPAVPGSALACKLDGPGTAAGSFTPCTSPKAYSSLADGAYAFTVRATDPAGNATMSARTFTVETVPDTTITSGPPSATNQTSSRFDFTASAAGSTFECKLDTPSGAGGYAVCASGQSYATTANGAYTFSVRAVGPRGADPTPATSTFTVDTVAPETTVTGGPPPQASGGTQTFSFTSSDPGSTFTCELNGPAGNAYYSGCTSPWTSPTPQSGTYTFSVRAWDSGRELRPDARDALVHHRQHDDHRRPEGRVRLQVGAVRVHVRGGCDDAVQARRAWRGEWQLRELHVTVCLQRPRRRHLHVRGPRDRGRGHRRDARQPVVHRRHDPARRDDHVRPIRDHDPEDRVLRVLRQRTDRPLGLRARRAGANRRVRGVPDGLRLAAGRGLHVRGAGEGRGRERGHGAALVHDRARPAGDDHHERAVRADQPDGAVVRVLVIGGRIDVRVQARHALQRGRLRRLHIAAGVHDDGQRGIHVLGPRERPRRHGRDAGDPLVHGRHRCADHDDRLRSDRLDDRRHADVHVLLE